MKKQKSERNFRVTLGFSLYERGFPHLPAARRWEVVGVRIFQQRRFFLAPNHQSLLDPPLVGVSCGAGRLSWPSELFTELWVGHRADGDFRSNWQRRQMGF
jgi:1-acyl-sn-glycerol-3-phosphate acyltransferase